MAFSETKKNRLRGEKHILCSVEDVAPGEVRGFRVGGRRVAAARLDDGSFRVLADVCPHQAAKMSDGSIEKMWVSDAPGEMRQSEERNVLLCPWHGFEFDLESGGDPCVPGRPDLRLKTYPVEIEEDRVTVRI